MASVLVRLAVSAVGFGLLGAAAVHGPFGASRIEGAVEAAVSTALTRSGQSWARPDADGQTVRLFGEAPDEAARSRAAARSLRAIGPGGRLLGAVTKASVGDVTLAPPFVDLAAYRFSADFRGGTLSLAGMVPSADARAAILATNPTVAIDDTTSIAPLAAEGDWRSAMKAALSALLVLESGEVRQAGATIAIKGKARDDAAAEAAERLIARASGVFTLQATIERPAPIPPPAPRTAGDPEKCRAAIRRVMSGRRLTFTVDSAGLSRSDRALLDRLAEQTSACGGLTIYVEGHTDSDGSRRSNYALSARRAKAVARYLAAVDYEGVLIVKSYGETRPIAPNRTARGRARNRRIDFVVAPANRESD